MMQWDRCELADRSRGDKPNQGLQGSLVKVSISYEPATDTGESDVNLQIVLNVFQPGYELQYCWNPEGFHSQMFYILK